MGFAYVSKGDKREEVRNESHDSSYTVSARDAEHAIAKVRAKAKREKHDIYDDDGNETGRTAYHADIVVHHVTFVSSVDVG